ncbi:Tctex-1 family [Popillia japonica]|uniref:Tctex-1 family n=1 Tax=Popillia japonica TaxID=7064 RepID=A0AAW1LCY1_POPJA
MADEESATAEDKDAIKIEDSTSVMAKDPTETASGTPETVSAKMSTESIHPINTYQIKPALANKFKADPVKDLIHGILTDTLTGQVYDSKSAKKWTVNIANKINEKIKSLQMKRYKHVVQVTLGEMKGAGICSINYLVITYFLQVLEKRTCGHMRLVVVHRFWCAITKKCTENYQQKADDYTPVADQERRIKRQKQGISNKVLTKYQKLTDRTSHLYGVAGGRCGGYVPTYV